MIRISIIALVLLVGAGCAGNEPAQNESAMAAIDEEHKISDRDLHSSAMSDDEGDLVCRYEKTIGSRIGKRICRTEAAEAALREASQDALEKNAYRTDRDRIVTSD